MNAIELFREHGTKVIGYITVAAGAIAVMDPQLVADTLGPNAVRWALVVTGVLTALRGHTNTIRARQSLPTTETSR